MGEAFKRPARTQIFADRIPGNKLPGYFQMSLWDIKEDLFYLRYKFQ